MKHYLCNLKKHFKSFAHLQSKEFFAFFSSPIAYIFLGLFAAVCFFILFWFENFFVRNVADLRPFFDWMPLVLIFFCAALTMRMWTEERSKHTIDLLMTSSTPLWLIALSKLFASALILLLGLLMLLILPFLLSIFGGVHLDWGLIFWGFVGSWLLGTCYCAVGLFVSAISKNQIFSLLISSLILFALYLFGQPFFQNMLGSSFWLFDALGALSPVTYFDSISRGVLSASDMYYIVFVTSIFLILNVFALRRTARSRVLFASYLRSGALIIVLAINLFLPNVWLSKVDALRFDVTSEGLFSLSDVTKNYLKRLEQPMRIRAFFSKNTHPLIVPLAAQLEDLLKEYQVYSNDWMNVSFEDPTQDEQLAEQVRESFAVEAIPLRVNGRHESSIVSAYFNVVVEYGDLHQVLGFNDLVHVAEDQNNQIQLSLNNPEYQMTKAIKSLMANFGQDDDLFRLLQENLILDFYVSENAALPESMQKIKPKIIAWLDEKKQELAGRFNYRTHDVVVGEDAFKSLEEKGVLPYSSGLFTTPFYFNFSFNYGLKSEPLLLTANFSLESFKNGFERALKRLVTENLKQISFYFNEGDEQARTLYLFLKEKYGAGINQLHYGSALNDSDLLVVYRPSELTADQVLSIDQFLVQGGRVIVMGSLGVVNYEEGFFIRKTQPTGLEKWLDFHGLALEEGLIKDDSNINFPVLVQTGSSLSSVQYQLVPYPYFVNLRPNMLASHVINANLPNMMIPWAGMIDASRVTNSIEVTHLITPSEQAWKVPENSGLYPSSSDDIEFYQTTEDPATKPIAVLLEGPIDSYFEAHELPDLPTGSFANVVKTSVKPAKLLLANSSNFFDPTLFSILSSVGLHSYVQNHFEWLSSAVEYMLDDTDLTEIRYKNYQPRLLPNFDKSFRAFVEYFSYFFVGVFLGFLYLLYRSMSWLLKKRHLNKILGEENGR